MFLSVFLVLLGLCSILLVFFKVGSPAGTMKKFPRSSKPFSYNVSKSYFTLELENSAGKIKLQKLICNNRLKSKFYLPSIQLTVLLKTCNLAYKIQEF